MTRLPERRFPARLPRILLLGLGLAGTSALGVWLASDHLLRAAYEGIRPRLERQVGQVMGRPLQLGPYRGLGLDGLRVGPSRFLSGPRDRSTASVRELRVRIAPLASLRQREAVLDLEFSGAQADLHRNRQGELWVFGPFRPGGEPPPLDVQFRLRDPAPVRIWDLGAARGPLRFLATGRVELHPPARSIEGRLQVRAPNQPGTVAVRGQGNWRQRLWRADLATAGFRVEPFLPLLPLGGALEGSGSGNVALTLRRGLVECRGRVRVEGLRWRSSPAATAVAADRLPLECKDRTLTLDSAPWRYGAWRGRVAGHADFGQHVGVRLQAFAPPGHPLGSRPLEGDLLGRWQNGGLQVSRLSARLGRSDLRARGRLGRRLDLAGEWRLEPADIPRVAALPAGLRPPPLGGSLRVAGTLRDPELRARTEGARHPLLGPWQALVAWSAGSLRLERFQAPELEATARIPVALRPGRGLVWGELEARLNLKGYPLPRLDPVLGTRLSGLLEGGGTVRGPLASLRPDLWLRARQPGAGPLQLRETWAGTLRSPDGAGGSLLGLVAEAPAPAGRLEARLDPDWWPRTLELQRGGGLLRLDRRPKGYGWQARSFPLEGLALALRTDRRLHTLLGDLSGEGGLDLQPLAFAGRAVIESPQFLGVAARRLNATGSYAQRDYRIRGDLLTLGSGTVRGELNGRWQGPFRASLQARGLRGDLLRQLAAAWPRWRGAPAPPRGQAADLGSLAIDTLAGSLQDQLLALGKAQALAATRSEDLRQAPRAERLARLQMGVDADLTLAGADFRQARLDLDASGHLWMAYENRDQALEDDPFRLRLQGPLGSGSGSFDLSGLSLSLLALLIPVPESLRGRLALQGRYRLGGARPELLVDLSLSETRLAGRELRLERGLLKLQGDDLAVDLAVRAPGAASDVTLAGRVPLDPSRPGLELRLASRDDGLHFLTHLAGGALEWKRGAADLQLLVRGSLQEPIANGFLRLRGGECRFLDQTLRAVEATVLFDFQQMLVQNLSARVGPRGRIQGDGVLGLVRPLSERQSLKVDLREVPFAMQRLKAVADGRLTLGGSLRSPALGGDLTIAHGTINAQPSQLSRSAPVSNAPARPTSMRELVESRWDFREPLVLLGPEVESTTAEGLKEQIPRFPYLAFEGLRLRLGPDLRVVLPNVANFTTEGSLRISGRLDPSLRASGVVRLLGGRLNLFTTTFSLDPDAPNVAVFTPSLGLIPYLDVALRTRISDSLNVIAPGSFGASGQGAAFAPSLADVEARTGFSSLSQLKLILVTVSVSGPADRIAENIRLRSSPPLPQERLVALIGGNSLAGLSGGSAGTALATVLGQSLLSPLLSSLSDALGQRVSLALYPTYVNQQITNPQEVRSRRVPPQLVLGAEVGFDLTDRLNASVLAAPNRSDVPPQLTLNYKASENLNLTGSLDSQGAWQGQFQVFFRF